MYFIKRGDTPVETITYKKYAKTFLRLFGDCQELVDEYEKYKFYDFEQHVARYHEFCPVKE